VLLTWIATSALAEPSQYLCAVEKAVGFHFDSQIPAWLPQQFEPRKYVFRRLTPEDRNVLKSPAWASLARFPEATWAFFEFGEELPGAACVKPDGFFLSPVLFSCWKITYDASFDENSLRFEVIYHGGYVDQGLWDKFRREDPETYKRTGCGRDDYCWSHLTDLSIEFRTCSPS
jgi:hypothetical protein